MEFEKVKNFIDGFLRSGLPSVIFYHDYFHTMDVLNACIVLAKAENITDQNELIILKTAALFHDSGFVNAYNGHEEEGCLIAKKNLPGFQYSQKQIDTICSLIMATKVPQNPVTHLEKILCDADLDYLGRDDYSFTAGKLFNEWKSKGKINSEKEWIKLQINFLESHHYWTNSAISKGQNKKEINLRKLKELI